MLPVIFFVVVLLLFLFAFSFCFPVVFFFQLPLVAALAINSGSIARSEQRSRGLLDMRSTQIKRVPLHSCLFVLKLYGTLYYLRLGASYASYAAPLALPLPVSLSLPRTVYTWTMLEINVINAHKCSNSVIS